MKRRQFIQKSALAAATLAMPWSNLHAQSAAACSYAFEAYKWLNEKNESYKIYMELCKGTITAYEKAEAHQKIIKLIINQNLKDAEGKLTIKEYAAELKIKSVKKDKNVETDYKVETEFLQENKNQWELPKELNVKKLSFTYHQKADMSTIDVPDKKGNTFLTIVEKPPRTYDYDDDDDCFLTTACVNILGKPDDCFELSTLRRFRDEHLKTNAEGMDLVKEYYHIAPNIVKAIAVRDDKRLVYTNIYNEMIIPTIDCIERNDNRGAISIYKDYTLMLRDKYLQ